MQTIPNKRTCLCGWSTFIFLENISLLCCLCTGVNINETKKPKKNSKEKHIISEYLNNLPFISSLWENEECTEQA